METFSMINCASQKGVSIVFISCGLFLFNVCVSTLYLLKTNINDLYDKVSAVYFDYQSLLNLKWSLFPQEAH